MNLTEFVLTEDVFEWSFCAKSGEFLFPGSRYELNKTWSLSGLCKNLIVDGAADKEAERKRVQCITRLHCEAWFKF
jgi:hypothetical protein